MQFETFFIDNQQALEDLVAYEAEEKSYPLFLDLETDSLSERKANIMGIGLSFKKDQAFYIPLRDNERNLLWENFDFIATWLKEVSAKRGIIGHNVLYDVLVLEYSFLHDYSCYIKCDTMLLKHTINEERPHGLKEVAVKYLGPWANKAQQAMIESIKLNGGKATKECMEMWKADTDLLGEYCCWDVLLTQRLYDFFSPTLVKESLYDLFYKEEVMPLYQVTIDMKRHGFHVDLPHFELLNKNIVEDMRKLEKAIQDLIAEDVKKINQEFLEKSYPIKTTGSFPKAVAQVCGIKLTAKNDKVQLNKKAIEEARLLNPEAAWYFEWLTNKQNELLSPEIIDKARNYLNGDSYAFNLNSNDHLGKLLFGVYGEKPAGKTETGKPQINAEYLETLAQKYEWVALFVDLKKLEKLKGTYIEGILDRQEDGIIYTSMLQHGTTSGRYSSTSPNLQNAPRLQDESESKLSSVVLKYSNAIRKGFIAPDGYIIIDADQSALEPRCFATVSGDKNLQNIFINNEDMYSSIAIRSFGAHEYSPFKTDANYLGKHKKELRNRVKTYALAVAYGAGASRIASLLSITKDEAQSLIDDYLDAYPGLKNYINSCHTEAKTKGMVRTRFGRIRHLPRAKELYSLYGEKLQDWRYVRKLNLKEEQYELKNLLNNSTNMPIQGLAAHIMNRSAIAIFKDIKEQNLDAHIALQVHDQLIVVAKKEQAEQVKKMEGAGFCWQWAQE